MYGQEWERSVRALVWDLLWQARWAAVSQGEPWLGGVNGEPESTWEGGDQGGVEWKA
jgi:hypothetical protein